MDLLGAIRIAIRRWYILAPLVVLSVFGSLAVRDQIQPSYEIDGVLPIVAPFVSTQEAADQLARNNFLDLGATSAVMASLGDSAEIRQVVEERGGDPDYEIASASGALTIAISTDGAERALATYRLVGEELRVRLDALQGSTGVPAAFRVSISDALEPAGAVASTSDRKRAVLASLTLGLVVSLATCVFADHLLSQRRRRAVSEPSGWARGEGAGLATNPSDERDGTGPGLGRPGMGARPRTRSASPVANRPGAKADHVE
jgi:hypothetical protein